MFFFTTGINAFFTGLFTLSNFAFKSSSVIRVGTAALRVVFGPVTLPFEVSSGAVKTYAATPTPMMAIQNTGLVFFFGFIRFALRLLNFDLLIGDHADGG